MKKLLLIIAVIVSASVLLTGCAVFERVSDYQNNDDEKGIRIDDEDEDEDDDDDDAASEIREEAAVDVNTFAELIKTYAGSYSDGVSWHFGGTFILVECGADGVSINYHEIAGAPNSRDAEISLFFDYDDIQSDVLTSEFEDNYGNKGKISITFCYGNEWGINTTITDLVNDDMAVWGVYPGTKKLFTDEYVAEKTDYSYEDYENWENNGFPEFTFDTKSKTFFYSLPEKPKNLIENMTTAEKRILNVFLSNFSEISFDRYGYGDAYENESLISFAFLHNNYNSTGKVFMTNSGYYAMTAENVDITLNRYFGRSVPRVSTGAFIYSDGNFHVEPAAGSGCSYFSVATGLYDNNDGTYSVEFEIFSDMDSSREVDSTSYSCTPETARAYYTYSHCGNAVVTTKTYNGTQTYELQKYTISY